MVSANMHAYRVAINYNYFAIFISNVLCSLTPKFPFITTIYSGLIFLLYICSKNERMT